MRQVAAASVAVLMAAAAGCSQVAQLQPVAGGQISSVRAATNDVLVDHSVPIAVAPVCEYEEPLFVCRGTTPDGKEIMSEAEVITPYGETKDQWGAYEPAVVSLVVKVGADTIYTGSVEEVLVGNGQAAQ